MIARSDAERVIATLQPCAEAYERSKRPGASIAEPGPLERLCVDAEPVQAALDVDPQLDLGL
jgi:hypothetical protein